MASGSQELERFVHEALVRGESKESIAQALSSAGWRDAQTRGLLDAYADVPFVVPVPRPRASLSAREAFLYLVMFASLYFAAWHLGSLLFDLINIAWPDPSDSNYAWRSFDYSLRWSCAALIIAFPVFAFVSWFVGRDVARDPIKRLSPVRRWLTYLTLFVAAVVLIGDLTTLVFNLLGGELTTRFVLKVLVVGVLAGGVFGYYLQDLRREEGAAPGRFWSGRGWLIGTGVVVLATLVAAFFEVRTPMEARKWRQDQRRIEDLTALKAEIETWAGQTGALPSDLDVVAQQPGVKVNVSDPFDSRPYRYSAIDARRYRLCAFFTTDSAARADAAAWTDRQWRHPRGEHCFMLMLPERENK